ncbi:MAG TPA: serine hydrolase domain-containing protein [Bacteriovoracaceae bacterium]|nr:serine hydrolase domain-containing protein [Bacteriovoracaceae bacterium]
MANAVSNIKQKYNLPGLAGALFKNGSAPQIAAAGLRKFGSPEELTTTDKFHIGSCTKSMTATVVGTFIEDGQLSWTSKLSDLLPELEFHPSMKEVTFEMLLAHRSGLVKDPSSEIYARLKKLETSQARKETAEIFLKSEPKLSPGAWNYSNIGYIIAGYILERISGKSWEMLLSERVFSKLGMSSCGFGPTSVADSETVSNPWGHYLEDGKLIPIHFDNAAFYGPAGTVHCSLQDWNKYLSIHTAGFKGSDGFLKAETFKKLHTRYPEEGETYTYGGWRRLKRNWAKGETLTHSGSNVMNYATVWIAPEIEAVLLSTSNMGDSSAQTATNEVLEHIIKLFLKN